MKNILVLTMLLLITNLSLYSQTVKVNCKEIKPKGADARPENNSFLIKKDSIIHGEEIYLISKKSYNATWDEDIYDCGRDVQFILDEYGSFLMKSTGLGASLKIISYRKCIFSRQ